MEPTTRRWFVSDSTEIPIHQPYATVTLAIGRQLNQPHRSLEIPMTPPVQLCLVLSENWTLLDPHDLRRLVDYATTAEEAGIAGVMVGEHVAMGPNAAANGLPLNPRG